MLFLTRRELAQKYKNVFLTSDEGKFVLHDLIRQSGLLRTGSTDAERRLMLRILALLNLDSEDKLMSIIQESYPYRYQMREEKDDRSANSAVYDG